jgi:hypothetical protein
VSWTGSSPRTRSGRSAHSFLSRPNSRLDEERDTFGGRGLRHALLISASELARGSRRAASRGQDEAKYADDHEGAAPARCPLVWAPPEHGSVIRFARSARCRVEALTTPTWPEMEPECHGRVVGQFELTHYPRPTLARLD